MTVKSQPAPKRKDGHDTAHKECEEIVKAEAHEQKASGDVIEDIALPYTAHLPLHSSLDLTSASEHCSAFLGDESAERPKVGSD